jgi:hypothetical protein
MSKAYYGRCMAIYGRPQESRDIELIKRLGYRVIEFPNQEKINERKAKGENVMETIFKPLVVSADIMFFRGLPSGKIPAGVGKEIEWAREAGLDVLEIPSTTKARTISIEATREYLREVMR